MKKQAIIDAVQADYRNAGSVIPSRRTIAARLRRIARIKHALDFLAKT
jgi:hypothetical protein